MIRNSNSTTASSISDCPRAGNCDWMVRNRSCRLSGSSSQIAVLLDFLPILALPAQRVGFAVRTAVEILRRAMPRRTVVALWLRQLPCSSPISPWASGPSNSSFGVACLTRLPC